MATTCERAQLALVEGQAGKWIVAHVADCSECRFFADLSSQFTSAERVTTSAPLTDLGSAFEALLDRAVESERPLARYRLQQRIGRGGQGVVYRAIDTETGETVALKVVRCRTADRASVASEVALAHLVTHPNVCRVHHTERHGDVRLIVMEFIEGQRLDVALPSLSPAQRTRLFRGVCEAVSAAHAAGVLHLDLKPANILLRKGGAPVVTDFGLAARASEAAGSSHQGGTPGYMAPEQLESGRVDHRTDVYALGVILRELFPVPGGSRGLNKIVERATAASPERRYPDVNSLLQALDRPARLRRRAAYVSAALASLGLVVFGLMPLRGARPPKGDVLVLGGRDRDGRWHASAEIFDARSKQWRTIEPVPDPGRSVPRTCAMRAVRSGDEVLVLGGGGATGCADDGTTTNRVRIYSLASRNWSVPECQAPCVEHQGSTFWLDFTERDRLRWKKGVCRPEGPCMLFGRNTFVGLRLLPTDDVFVYGGCAGGCMGPNELEQLTIRPTPMGRMAEIYRRVTGAWWPVAPSQLPRPQASGVNVGASVLVCGGYDDSSAQPYAKHDTCEIFARNKDIGAWRPAGRMPVGGTIASVKMVALSKEIVLGLQPGHAWLWRHKDWWDSSEWRWDETFFEPVPLPIPDPGGVALTALGNGRGLLLGGEVAGRVIPTAKIFTLGSDGNGGNWKDVTPMTGARRNHAAAMLEDGRVLVAGGCGPEPLSSAEIYDPVADRWIGAGRMSAPRCEPEAVAIW